MNHRYRVLMLAPTGFFSDYGCHVRILEEASVLQKRGHRLSICTYHRGRDLAGLDVLRIPRVPWGRDYSMGSSWHKLTFDAMLLVRSLLECRENPPHLIHAFLHEGAWIGSFLSRILHVPLVFDYQGSLTGEMGDHGFLRRNSVLYKTLQRLEVHINNLPDAIITSSAHAAQLLRSDLGCRCPVIRTVPDCVDTTRFRPMPADWVGARRQELGLTNTGCVVAYLGKLADYQGTDLLLDAAAQLCATHPALHFLVMGYPHVWEYREKAANLGLAGRITFTGRIPYEQAAEYLALADIAVAPKISETESNGKLLNYMAVGLPTVAFDTPVAHEYLGAWGQYATAQDASSLAAAIGDLLCSESQREYLGQQLRKRARRLYAWESAGDRIERVYQLVCQQTTRGEVVPSYSGKIGV